MNSRRRRSRQCNHGDEVIVHVADLLMTLALDFENSHLGEILRYRDSR
jgi:hypothetical protein